MWPFHYRTDSASNKAWLPAFKMLDAFLISLRIGTSRDFQHLLFNSWATRVSAVLWVSVECGYRTKSSKENTLRRVFFFSFWQRNRVAFVICAHMQMCKAAPAHHARTAAYTLLPLLVCRLSTAHVRQMQQETDEREWQKRTPIVSIWGDVDVRGGESCERFW